MSSRTTTRTRRGALVTMVAGPLALGLAGAPAVATDGAISSVVNTETVQVLMDADGATASARVYEQLAVTGRGKVEIVNPVSTRGLRNLDGFGGFAVQDGAMVTTVHAGEEPRLRTVSTFDGDLPLDLEVTYRLDGVEVSAEDVVGRSGDLEVTYRVTNTTAQPRKVRYDDGTGKMVTETLDVVVPMVGSLTTVLPSGFADVTTTGGNVAGDGRGGTKLTFTLTLFPPIGSAEVELGWSAKIRDGVVPPASLSAMPVQPLESASFKSGAASYQSGAETGRKLALNAGLIDENLLKLHDGSASLLAGILQLRDGAAKLRNGLQGEAAPGAVKLADGAVALDAGAVKLADGAGTAAAGADALAAGVAQISGGLDQLSAVEGLPAAGVGLQQLRYAVDHPVGAGGAQDPGGLLQGLRQVQAGLSNPGCDPANPGDPANPCGVSEGLKALAAGLPTAKAGLDAQVTDGLTRLRAGVDGRLVPGVRTVRTGLDESLREGGSIDQLAAAVAAAKSSGCTGSCPVYLTGVEAGIHGTTDKPGLKDKTEAARNGLGQVLGGLSNPQCEATDPTNEANPCGVSENLGLLAAGTQQVSDGLTAAIGGVASLQQGVDGRLVPGVATIAGGVDGALLDGIDQILAGVTKAVTGVTQLSAGGQQASQGAAVLAAGLPTLADGADQLADGTGELKAGASTLADGLRTAADGSGELADGLVTAAAGAPQIVDGTKKLSVEGTSLLTEAGKDTAKDYGSKYALIEAGNERAATEGMAFGAPQDASGLTAYTFELAGEDGESGRNLVRGVGALVVFGLGAGLVAGLRRKVF